ncbi:MAG: FAD-dependent oxidoreductase [Candidatus Pacearchaeota archaeon]
MKIAIVGGGIVGSYLAYKLSKKYDVTVFEKNFKQTKKVCSGLISERIWGFIPKNKGIIENEFNKIILYFQHKKIELILKQKLYAFNREKLDNYVFSLAKKSEANYIFNSYISGINDEKLKKFDKIIGCDGAFSSIRRTLKLKDPEMKLGIILYTKEKGNDIEVWSHNSGFFWKIPRKNKIEYGCLAKPNEAKSIFDNFIKKQNIEVEKIYSAYIPCGLIIPKSEKYTLCGDAAGITKPWSGGGIIWSFSAADLLIANFPDFRKYRKHLYNKFLYRQRLGKIANYFVKKINFILPNSINIDIDYII